MGGPSAGGAGIAAGVAERGGGSSEHSATVRMVWVIQNSKNITRNAGGVGIERARPGGVGGGAGCEVRGGAAEPASQSWRAAAQDDTGPCRPRRSRERGSRTDAGEAAEGEGVESLDPRAVDRAVTARDILKGF